MDLAGFNLAPVLPEFILAIGSLAILLFGAILGERSAKVLYEVAIVIIGIVLLIVVLNKRDASVSFDGASWTMPSRIS